MASDTDVSAKTFRRAQGTAEHFVTITADAGLDARAQTALVAERYADWMASMGLTPETAVFRRIFVSDAINQINILEASLLVSAAKTNPVAVSLVQQPPQPNAKIALLAYHLDGGAPLVKLRLTPRHMVIERNGLSHLWSTRMCCGARSASAPEEVHTLEIFQDLIGMLSRLKGTLEANCVRTWLYLKEVDVFYRGMVNSRRDLFIEHGLTEDTHYISSTGIQGCCEHQFDLVMMDAYSILGLKPGQMTYLNDFERLCATKDYNVTFERGTRIAYRDRAHHYISGTASIDKYGNTVHLGDVMAQLDLALINVDALLRSGGASLADMMYLIVYLRDPSDHGPVRQALEQRLPGLPLVIVEGAVCRPEWLIEVEGVACADHDDPGMPSF